MRRLTAAILLAASPVWAGFTFGQNKVRTAKLDWRVVETDHFRVYHDSAAYRLASIAGGIAERQYDVLSERLGVEPDLPVPLIVYASPDLFAQTNVIPYVMPEAVGGFFEFWKGRVVVPFDGSYADFEHVVKHELVHVFTVASIDNYREQAHRTHVPRVPLWFVEGLAEYWSEGRSPEMDIVLRDLVLGQRLLPPSRLGEIEGTFQMYKQGQAIIGWWAEQHGDSGIVRLLKMLPGADDFEGAVERAFGDDFATLEEAWVQQMRKRYLPVLADADQPETDAVRLTTSGASLAPVVSRDGRDERVAFMSGRRGYTEIRLVDRRGGRRSARTILRGERSEAYESLHFGRSSLGADTLGDIAFSARSGGSDVVVLIDPDGRELRRLRFEGVLRVVDPVLSSNGDRVAFVGAGSDGFSNLYLYDAASKSLDQLTSDEYGEWSPAFSPDGRSLAYVSDRTDNGHLGLTRIVVRDLEAGAERVIAAGRVHDPSYSQDGRLIMFESSSDDGTSSLVAVDSSGDRVELASYSTAVREPRFLRAGGRVVFSAYHDGTFDLYERDFGPVLAAAAEDTSFVIAALPSLDTAGDESPWSADSSRASAAASEYKREYSFDVASAAVEYSALLGVSGGFEIALSDMLGDHLFHFYVSNTAQQSSDVVESFNVVATYLNQSSRFSLGAGAFHVVDEYEDDLIGLYREREIGALGVVAYPFSRFRRVELTGVFRVSIRDEFLINRRREEFLSTAMVSLVQDNSLWEESGPIDGVRANATVAVTFGASGGELAPRSRLAFVDLRHYLRIGLRSAWANRFWAAVSDGAEPDRFHLGGSWSLRGYDRRAFTGRQVVFLSSELRFPLVDRVIVEAPLLGGFRLPPVRGAVFADAGRAFDRDFPGFAGAVGWGLRFPFGPFLVLRYDHAWPVRQGRIAAHPSPSFYFGWNF